MLAYQFVRVNEILNARNDDGLERHHVDYYLVREINTSSRSQEQSDILAMKQKR